jgi:uncharacterized protein YdaT
MPWDESNYPVSMKNLMAPVRRKAIEMANALVAEGMDDGRAIAISTLRAEQWARRRGKPVKKDRTSARSTTRRGRVQHA